MRSFAGSNLAVRSPDILTAVPSTRYSVVEVATDVRPAPPPPPPEPPPAPSYCVTVSNTVCLQAGKQPLLQYVIMSKHSKQAHTREAFTAAERERASVNYGTVKQRLGSDSQIKFDQCNICLSGLVDAVCSPAGYLYCRECIYKNLLTQKQVLEEQRRAFAEEQAQREREAASASATVLATELREFEQLATGPGVLGNQQHPGSSSSAPRQNANEADIISSLSRRVDPRSQSERIADAQRSSFWVAGATPSAPTRAKAPDPAPRDPMSGDFLRAKQLVTLKLSRNSEDVAGRGAGASSSSLSSSSSAAAADRSVPSAAAAVAARWMCPVCNKGIVFQKTFAMKACGHVLCEPCVKRFVTSARKCAVCSVAVPAVGDVIGLQQQGSSFAGNRGTQTEAKVYVPPMM